MRIAEIKKSVDIGEKVFWSSTEYQVIKDNLGQYLIMHKNGHCVGLTENYGDDKFFTWYEREEITDKLVQHDIEDIMRAGAEGDFSYLSDVLTGDGFTPYGDMTIQELNDEWMERLLFDIEEERV